MTENNDVKNVDETLKQLGIMMESGKDIIDILESKWNGTKDEFGITEAQVTEVYKFNEEHSDPRPQDETVQWDRYNGVYKMDINVINEIFKDTLIIGITDDITYDRVRMALSDLVTFIETLAEYRQLHNEYSSILDEKQKLQIELLTDKANSLPDGDEKDGIIKSIEEYHSNKELRFLANISKEEIDRIRVTFSDEKKISYMLDRTRNKMKQAKLPDKFILEISQFEKRYLDKKYHEQSNVLLLYFLNMMAYCDLRKANDTYKIHATSMIFTMDEYIRNVLSEDTKAAVFENIIKFEDIFLEEFNNESKE